MVVLDLWNIGQGKGLSNLIPYLHNPLEEDPRVVVHQFVGRAAALTTSLSRPMTSLKSIKDITKITLVQPTLVLCEF